MMPRVVFICFLLAAYPSVTAAQATQTFTIQNGKLVGGGAAATSGIGAEQRMMLEASAKAVSRDFKGAETLYSQVLAANGGNAEAWLQRGVVRREMGDKRGSEADARAAITLVDAELRLNPRNPNLYYRRSMALRLLGAFDQAKKDLQSGMALGGDRNWETDLKAIDLEEKMAAQR